MSGHVRSLPDRIKIDMADGCAVSAHLLMTWQVFRRVSRVVGHLGRLRNVNDFLTAFEGDVGLVQGCALPPSPSH